MSIYFLPETEEFGKLSIIKEYYRYDVPRAFVVHSRQLNKDLLVYWVDEFEDSDTWYYVDFSKIEQERVESGFIQLRDAFRFKKIFEIKTYFDIDLAPELKLLTLNEVDYEALPLMDLQSKEYLILNMSHIAAHWIHLHRIKNITKLG